MATAAMITRAFNREKPHSSVTDWIDLLSAPTIAEEAYDGIPEVVDAINLQPREGPGEAARAIRKKLKHGNSHQQYRALVILKALVENCDKFRLVLSTDYQLTDAIKYIAANPDKRVDKRVQKKLLFVLKSWSEQFSDDPSMNFVAGFYQQFKAEQRHGVDVSVLMGLDTAEHKRRVEKEEAKKKARQEKEEARERHRQEEEERKRNKHRSKRTPFDFERDKPKVLACIVEASQAISNLQNAITLVNTETDSLQTNQRVQDCLNATKLVRKQVVRYVQLVENEELIGTLIETNDRLIASLETYDNLVAAYALKDDMHQISSGMASVDLKASESEVSRLQEKQRAAVERSKQASLRGASSDAYVHPDLQDLNFGSIGTSPNNLPQPLRPSNLSDEDDEDHRRGSLSDFSDYDSSDEATHKASPSRRRRSYVNVSDNSDDEAPVGITSGKQTTTATSDDPFADPFADDAATGSSHKW